MQIVMERRIECLHAFPLSVNAITQIKRLYASFRVDLLRTWLFSGCGEPGHPDSRKREWWSKGQFPAILRLPPACRPGSRINNRLS